MRPLIALPALTLGSALLALASGADPSAQDEPERVLRLPIVDRSIAFHGGDIHQRSRIALRITSATGSFRIRSVIDGGSFEHEVAGRVGDVERRVRYTNTSVERWDDGRPVELDERLAQQARNWVNARIYFPYLPFKLNDQNTFKQDLGLEQWDGRQLHRVKVTFRPDTSAGADDEYLFWFDPDSGRMEQFAYSFQSGQGGVRFRRAYAWHRVGGVLFSDQENWAVDGQGVPVDVVTPEYVRTAMHLMSKVEITDIDVEPLT